MATSNRFPPRYPLLDSCRGFACVIVVLHHAGFLLNGSEDPVGSWEAVLRGWTAEIYRRMDLGVPLFFVISGYCIAASMDSHSARGASSWRFLGRRVWRIYPPYWAAVLVSVAIVGGLNGLDWKPIRVGSHSLHLDNPRELSIAQWVGNLTLTETWRHQAFGGSSYRNFTRISWTLCFEEQFYLVCFALLFLFPRRLFLALGVVSGLIFAVCSVADDAGWFHKFGGIFPEYWYQFAVGLAVYWRLVVARTDGQRRSIDVALIALMILGGYRKSLAMSVVAGFGLAMIALRPFDDALISRRALAPFRACGLRCYSIYLIHLPVCVVVAESFIQLGFTGFWSRALVAAPIAALAGVGAGWIFFSAVESRFLNPLPARLTSTRSRQVEGKTILATD